MLEFIEKKVALGDGVVVREKGVRPWLPLDAFAIPADGIEVVLATARPDSELVETCPEWRPLPLVRLVGRWIRQLPVATVVMARSTAWGSTASLSGAGAGARAGSVVPQPAITKTVTAATDRRAINSRTELQLRPMGRQRIAQDVQRVFERKAGGAPPGGVHRARATHGQLREGAPGAERTGIQSECYARRHVAGHRDSHLQGVDVG